MSAVMYDNAVVLFSRGELDWENAEIRVMLLTGGYRPSQTGDAKASDLRRFEVEPSGGYQRGGSRLGFRHVDQGVNEIRLLGGPAEWDGFTGEFRYAVLYNASDGSLVAYADLGNQQATNARVTVEYDAVAAFTVAAA